MLAPMNFRSAINGFRREDVVSYIEYLSAKHADEVNQLKSEMEYLRSRAVPAEAPEVRPEAEALNARIHELLERCAGLEDEKLTAAIEFEDRLRAAEDRCAQLDEQLVQERAARQQAEATAAQSAQAHSSHAQQELEAYRRAERTERMAQERAVQLERAADEHAQRTRQLAQEHAESVCAQANALLAEATVRVDAAARELGTLADDTLSRLAQLKTAVEDSKHALSTAAESLCAVRSTQE